MDIRKTDNTIVSYTSYTETTGRIDVFDGDFLAGRYAIDLTQEGQSPEYIMAAALAARSVLSVEDLEYIKYLLQAEAEILASVGEPTDKIAKLLDKLELL